MADGLTRYNTILEEATGEIVEKKSKFICNLYHIESDEEAAAIINALKKEHYQARHVCSAYILGAGSDTVKYSDDGEPSGTAGRPMLDILKGKGLTYTLACVTRYFGGVLLGTGGLVRAYSDSLNAGISNAKIVVMELQKQIKFKTDYTNLGKIKYALPGFNASVINEEYTDMVDITIAFPSEMESRVKKYICELTGGKALVEDLQETYSPVKN